MIQKLKVNPVAHFTRSEFNGYLDSVHALGEGRALCRVATFGKELHFFIVSAREMTKLSWVPEPEMTRQLSAPTASSSNTVNWQRGVAMLTREHLILWECLEDMPRVVTIEHPLSADRNGRLQDIHDVTMLSNKGCMVALLTKHSSKIDPVALARLSWTSASARAAWTIAPFSIDWKDIPYEWQPVPSATTPPPPFLSSLAATPQEQVIVHHVGASFGGAHNFGRYGIDWSILLEVDLEKRTAKKIAELAPGFSLTSKNPSGYFIVGPFRGKKVTIYEASGQVIGDFSLTPRLGNNGKSSRLVAAKDRDLWIMSDSGLTQCVY